MSSSIVIITIFQFDNCDGCREKVENTVDKLDGVELLPSDPGNGKFTVSTAIHPDVIVYALKRRFPTKQITWLPDKISLPDRLNPKHKDRPTTSRSPLPPRTPNSSSRSMPKPKAAVYGDHEQLNTDNLSVEITQSTTFKLNIRKHYEKQPIASSFVEFPMPPPPPSTIQPSAPPMPSDEDGDSVYRTSSRHEKRPVVSPVPPPTTKPSAVTEREKRRTTSGSVASPMPSLPPRTTKPSARPASITVDVAPTLTRREKQPSTSAPVPPRTTKPSARPTPITEDAGPILTRREKRRTTSSSMAFPRPPRTAQQPAIAA